MNLNGMLERVIVGSLTVRDTISVVVCGQKGRSWKEGRWGREGERGEEGRKKKGGGDGRKEGGMKRVYKRYNERIYLFGGDGDNIGVLQSLFKE